MLIEQTLFGVNRLLPLIKVKKIYPHKLLTSLVHFN